ncbi:hypothetical protein [Moorena sp. SIO3I8]|uniref:hypothetical protein n=1 Tax=Moorena sp. SIO3I8 TaxID=2607833 RepID=UPI0013C068EA|nr:hypothetical protein [Moorena sp. SIO3I8]NEO07852.1 hypothetical protein [Moorena sp. SIO3I8]
MPLSLPCLGDYAKTSLKISRIRSKIKSSYITNSRFPIPDSRFPIPDSQFPIPNYSAARNSK